MIFVGKVLDKFQLVQLTKFQIFVSRVSLTGANYPLSCR